MFHGVLTVHDPLARLVRRAAVGLGLCSTWFGHTPLALIIPAVIWGHVALSRRRACWLKVDRGALVSDKGSSLLSRHEYALAFPEGKDRICFVRRGAVVAELVLDPDAQAARDQLLEELGFGIAPSPLRVGGWLGPRTRSVASSVLLVLALISLAAAGARESIVGLLASSAALLLACASLIHRDLRLGRDGVWIAAAFRSHWVGFDRLRGVSRAGLWIRLHTDDGDLDVSPPLLWPGSRSRAAGDRLAHLIRRAHAQFERSPTVSTRALVGAKRERPESGDFRVAPTDLEDLAQLLSSPRAPGADRLRAARVLLRSPASEEAAGLVRLAAEQTACPSLERSFREVVEQLAEADLALAERPARRMHEGPVGSDASSHGIAPS